ncbi:MAG: aspartate aminotransferase family protein [Verrucomicrobiota bacterium]
MKTKNQETLRLLREFESRNVTFMEADGSWPMVWECAKGVYVWDANGRRYLDLTAAFGVAAAGHANARVVKAGQQQMARLLHAMGDVHPHALKARLARELSRITFERWTSHDLKTQTSSIRPRIAKLKAQRSKLRLQISNFKSQISNLKPAAKGKTIFCNSGFEAVEAALKTALLATGKPGVIAFDKGYHGLGYGALNATHRPLFRAPFLSQLGNFGCFVPFPTKPEELEKVECAISRLLRKQEIGAILVEPIQGRGGINVPPPAFLPMLRRLSSDSGALLIVDEVYTGLGRTGRWFACEHSETIPDLICLGKALTGGFPLSACVGRADLMDAAWPSSCGEAIHTSTFLGHPVGCAMALAQIAEIRDRRLVQRSSKLGKFFFMKLLGLQIPRAETRGLGLMIGVELRSQDGSPATKSAWRVVKEMLRRGYILLPEGENGNVLGFTPPLTIDQRQLQQASDELKEVLRQESML